VVLFNGCAYYSVTKTADGVEIKALSWRDLNTPYINYYRDGDDKVGFIFSADEVTSPSLKDLGDAADTVLNVLAYCQAYPVMCKGD
jgi:hypothetical protein